MLAMAVHTPSSQQQLDAILGNLDVYNVAVIAKKRSRSRDETSSPTASKRVETSTRQLNSATTSTSGRSPFLTLLQQQNDEIDLLVRLEMEKVKTVADESRKRRCRAMLVAMEQQVRARMEEKEAELEAARRRNVELQEKVRQVVAEGQIWFHVARSSEVLVSGLKASLEQALLAGKEGFGDNGDDATSCCYEGEAQPPPATGKGVCRACGEAAACVLVLPCRHLCLCESCEGAADACPVCRSAKTRSLKVFLS